MYEGRLYTFDEAGEPCLDEDYYCSSERAEALFREELDSSHDDE